MNNNTLIVKTLFGLENVLSKELQEIGFSDTKILNRGVEVNAEIKDIPTLNYNLNTALRVLLKIKTIRLNSVESIYKSALQIPWEHYFTTEQTFAIATTGQSPLFENNLMAALKTKDAIADRFRKFYDKRPSIDKKQPQIKVTVHLAGSEAVFLLDSSGDSLHKRGYKLNSGAAGLNEVLAAGILRLVGWSPKKPLLDLTCGAGTILLEALRQAKNLDNTKNRKKFSFKNWTPFQENMQSDIKPKITPTDNDTSQLNLYGSDIDATTIKMAKANAQNLFQESIIQWQQQDILKAIPPCRQPGVIICNLPYGERLSQTRLEEFYNNISGRLKHYFQGWEAWILSSNIEAMKAFALRPSKKIFLKNAQLDCKLYQFKLY